MKKSTGPLTLLLSAALLLTLTACTSQSDNQNNQANQSNTPTAHTDINDTLPVELLSIRADSFDYDSPSGIIDSNGNIIIPIDYTDKQVIRDENYQPAYIVTTKTTQSAELIEDLFSSQYSYDSVTHDGAIFTFYDTTGKLLQTVELSGRDITCHTSTNMADTLFVYEETTTEETTIEETTETMIEGTTTEESIAENITEESATDTDKPEEPDNPQESPTETTDISADSAVTPDINTDTDADISTTSRTFTTMNVVNMAGETIVSHTVELPPDAYIEWHYNGICNATDWFALYYNSYGTSALEPDIYRSLTEGCHFYTRDGKPLTMPHDYTSVYQVYDYNHTSGAVPVPYYQAYYLNSDGETTIDILDTHGQILVSGLSSINDYTDGLLTCSVRDENGQSEGGLVTMQGEWLYKESIGTINPEAIKSEATADDSYSDNPPRLLSYYSNGNTAILNTAGVAVIPPDDTIEKYCYQTTDSSGTYAVGVQDFYDYSRHDYWNQPLVSGSEFKFYYPTGDLLRTVDLRGRGDVQFIPGQTMDDGVFFCDMLNIDGTLLILRMDGTPITSVDLDIPTGTVINSFTNSLTLGENFVSAYYSCSKDYNNYTNGFICCTLDGEPVQLAHDYSTIYELYDAADRTQTTTRYFRADYLNSQGIYLFDILDGNANVVISGLNSIDTLYGNHLLCGQGNYYGMMDIQQGNWIFKESVFTDLND